MVKPSGLSDPSTTAQAFKTGCPPPPFYYKDYADLSNQCRPPPNPPTETWRLFGQLYTEKFQIENLSSDIQMYPDVPGTDLKQEFKRLFALYVKQIDAVIESIVNSLGNEGNEIKKLVKIYQNLMHILLRLRPPQTEEAVVNRFKKQLDQRRACIDSLKRALCETWLDLQSHQIKSPLDEAAAE